MATNARSQASFSPYRRWGIALHVCFIIFLVLAALVMVNYISRDYFLRLHVSTRTRMELAPRTVSLLKSLTNEVKVTLYYDQKDALYSTVMDLLKEYSLLNPRISVQPVDYLLDPGAAQKVKAEYKLGSTTDKNLVIFDCEGRVEKKEGNALAQFTLERIPDDKEIQFRRKMTAFQGEMAFDAALLSVTNPKRLNVYFLQGHYEHGMDSGDGRTGYLKFAALLQQNNLRVQPLFLLGTNGVPMDCNLLVVGGPASPIPQVELEKIEQYLNEGGRLLALFNYLSLNRETGLEKVLAKWGVRVGNNVVVDPEHSESGADVVVSAFSKHPLVNPLLGSAIYLVQPRTIGPLNLRMQPADAPHVEVIASSGQNSFILGEPTSKRYWPLIVAVEKGVKGVVTERGATRIVVVGDSLCLVNDWIDARENRAFAQYAVDWLLDRTQLLKGVGPRPVNEYKLVMTKSELQSAQWILLAGMPGGVLLLGGLVWLRRRR